MNDKEINELAGAWAADAIRRGREEGRSGRLYDELVPAYVAGFRRALELVETTTGAGYPRSGQYMLNKDNPPEPGMAQWADLGIAERKT